MICRQIYQAFLEHCVPYEPDGPWSSLQADVDLWRPPPPDALAVMESLQDDYSDEDLLASRLAVRSKQGWLVLNLAVTCPAQIIAPLRPQPTEPPFDLLIGDGVLSRRLPVCAALEDGSLQNAIEKTGALRGVLHERPCRAQAGRPPGNNRNRHGEPYAAALDHFCESYGLREPVTPTAPEPDPAQPRRMKLKVKACLPRAPFRSKVQRRRARLQLPAPPTIRLANPLGWCLSIGRHRHWSARVPKRWSKSDRIFGNWRSAFG